MMSPRSAAADHANPVTPQKRGYCDTYFKRLERGEFRFPKADEKSIAIDSGQLVRLLSGLEIVAKRTA